MKTNLYIDFDGVILDTITHIYNMLEKENISKDDFDSTRKFISTINWYELIEITSEINDSINCIKKIINTNQYEVTILTHVNSELEVQAKRDYIQSTIPGINIIAVPRVESKTTYVNPKNSILIDDYSVNLIEWEKSGGISIKFSTEEENNCPFKVINKLDYIIDILNKV